MKIQKIIVVLIIGLLFQNSTILAQTKVKIGDMAPDLSYMSPNGTLLKLSSLKGKMVLIDFWASWCKPCRYENPNVVAVYNKYKDSNFKNGKGFTVYSVSLDKIKNDWISAIKNDNLIWEYHVCDLKGWDAEAADVYGVRAIPSNYLIDGDGRVIAINLRGESLEKAIIKELK